VVVVVVVVEVERLAGRKRMQQVFCEEAHAEALAIAIVIVEIRSVANGLFVVLSRHVTHSLLVCSFKIGLTVGLRLHQMLRAAA